MPTIIASHVTACCLKVISAAEVRLDASRGSFEVIRKKFLPPPRSLAPHLPSPDRCLQSRLRLHCTLWLRTGCDNLSCSCVWRRGCLGSTYCRYSAERRKLRVENSLVFFKSLSLQERASHPFPGQKSETYLPLLIPSFAPFCVVRTLLQQLIMFRIVIATICGEL